MLGLTRKLKYFIIVSLLILAPLFAYGEPVYPRDTVIFYGNGVLADEDDAYASLFELQQRVLEYDGSSGYDALLTYTLAYNRTHELSHGLLDLAEAFIQYFQSFTIHFWHWLAGIDSLPDFAQDSASLIANLINKASIATNDNVQEHVDMYNRLLLECKRVIVVAHSQGNFYANMAAGGIDPNLADSFRIVSVANPASFVEGDGPYTTIEEDRVIALIPGSMHTNVDNYDSDESYSPWLGHYFVENYLSPDHLAEFKIVTEIINEITDVIDDDNTDYCGWPARYGTSIAVFREPFDMAEFDGVLDSQLWDKVVWPAVLRNEIIVEYRLGRSGSWTALTQSGLRLFTGSSWATYEADRFPNSIAPWVFFNDQYSNGTHSMDSTVEVQPDDVNFGVTKGLQQFRIILDNKVIDQFTVDYHLSPWSPVRTSGPVLDPLPEGSNSIELIH